ncbi:hypothetical protein GGI08_007327, partial [Coemansia sp. S2]
AGEDVGIKAKSKPRYRPPRKNKKKAESFQPQSQADAGASEKPKSVTAPWPKKGAKIVSARLSPAQSTWQDHWTPYDYAKNEVKAKHRQLIVLDLNGTLIKRGPRNSDKTRTGY